MAGSSQQQMMVDSGDEQLWMAARIVKELEEEKKIHCSERIEK